MNNLTLKQLVRNQILAEGPTIPDELSQRAHNELCDSYIDAQLTMMTNSDLLERLSDALVELQKPYDRSLWL